MASFALYLDALGWRAGRIGLLLTAAGLGGAGLSLVVGLVTDRHGRKPFLLAYESLIVIAGLAAFLTASGPVLAAAAVVAGFGRGQSGAAGPFSPAEGAWLAESIAPRDRGLVYSLNSALGFFGMALGGLAAGAVPLLERLLPGPEAYRPLFLLTAGAAMANLAILAGTPGGKPGPRSGKAEREAAAGGPPTARDSGMSRGKENRALVLLVLTNAFNGVAIGLTGPLIAYWFSLRFGVGPGSVGPMMAGAFVLTGLASLGTGSLTRPFGLVRSVVAARSVGLALLLALPVLPRYGLASAAYALRVAFNRGSAGARQALVMGLVSDDRRGLASSLNAVSMQLPATVGPTVAGYLFEAGRLALPFYLAAAMQLVYLALYAAFFRGYEP